MAKGRVGSKGELFPPKEIRDKLGLRARARVLYRIEGGRLVVEPVPSLEEVLKEPSSVELSINESHQSRKELSRKAET